MVRRRRLLAQVALVGAVLVLAFPSAGSALSAVFITLTPSGPSPAAVTIAGNVSPVWENTDTVVHTVSFANGLCSLQVAPGQIGQCSIPWRVGQYPYTVDGTFQASVVKVLAGRSVTLSAGSHAITRGEHLRLHGMLDYAFGSPPVLVSYMPVTLLARPDRHHPFRRIAVTSRPSRRQPSGFPWELRVHPKATTIYIAEATSDTDTYQPATSRPFKVVVRR